MLFILTSCNSPESKSVSLGIFERASINHPRAKQHLVFAFNPNDCMNCLYVFNELMQKWQKNPDNGITLVLKSVRSIERNDILQKSFATIDTTQVQLVWDTELYEAIQEAGAHNKLDTSVLEVYTADGKKIFRKEVRNISGAEAALQVLLAKE
ncbi:MAG: hypothetical protein ACRCYO_05505 [Bacteroidia bacterium]